MEELLKRFKGFGTSFGIDVLGVGCGTDKLLWLFCEYHSGTVSF